MLKPIIDESKVEAVRTLINRSHKIVITCHKSPDGDAIGSSLGLAHTLRSLGKDVKVVTPDRAPRNLSSLPGVSFIIPYSQKASVAERAFSEADLIFCLDFNALYRVDKMSDILGQATASKILVDHHQNPEEFADVIISHPEQSSTSALVYRLLMQLGIKNFVRKNAATCIYTGMMTDTGNFSYNSNDPDLYVIITELLYKGIDKDEIYKRVMNTKKASILKLHSYAIAEKMELYPELHTALIILTQEELKAHDYQPGDDEGLVNTPLSIEGIDYSVYLREDPHQIKVSTRSTGDFRADLICQDFYHGGGHINAAGGELKGLTMEEAIGVFRSTFPVISSYINKDYAEN